MNFKIAYTFAKKNMYAYKQLVIPFIFASSVMLILFYIMSSLIQNDYVRTRHPSLPLIVHFGIAIIAFFSLIFVIYANRFLMKRRNKEFALYAILGLEKKHIRRILLVEQVIHFSLLSVLSVIGGHIFGSISFLVLNRLLKDVSGRLMHYPFSQSACIQTFCFVLVLFILIYIINVNNIKNTSVIDLLSKQHKGDGEPKAKTMWLLLGLLTIILGYGIALRIEGTIQSMLFFFVAVILVGMATYLLFTTFSIFILKRMKSNPILYYKAKNFLSISGMMYRMKANATGLASIAILCTGVILSIASTATIYRNIEDSAKQAIPTDFSISVLQNYDISQQGAELAADSEQLQRLVRESVSDSSTITTMYTLNSMIISLMKDGNQLLPVNAQKLSMQNMADVIYGTVMTLEDYNHAHDESITLAKDELLLSANNPKLLTMDHLEINGKNYRIHKLENTISDLIVIDAYALIVPDEDTYIAFANYFQTYLPDENLYKPAATRMAIYWNLPEHEADYESNFRTKLREMTDANEIKSLRLESVQSIKTDLYELNGGFLFLGVVVGLLFLTGTILVTYYKQISEGYEDREQFQIMKKVGLPDVLIKKTSATQIVWMFYLPLIVAILHSIVASKIIFQLLRLFGVTKYMELGSNMAIVIALFALVYLWIFKITSNVYIKLVR